MLSYWAWLAIFVFLPMALMALWKMELVWKYKSAIALCGISALIFAVPWDNASIRDGLWGFPQQEISGIWFLGLPLEEFFFIFFVGAELSMAAITVAGAADA